MATPGRRGDTRERDLKMLKLWNAHELNKSEIGQRFGLNSATVSGIFKKLKAEGHYVRSGQR